MAHILSSATYGHCHRVAIKGTTVLFRINPTKKKKKKVPNRNTKAVFPMNTHREAIIR